MRKLLTGLLCLSSIAIGSRVNGDCAGSTMSTNEALARFPAGAAAIRLGKYQSLSWERFCTKQTGCTAWAPIAYIWPFSRQRPLTKDPWGYAAPDVRAFFPLHGESWLKIAPTGKVDLFLTSEKHPTNHLDVDDSFQCSDVENKVSHCNGRLGVSYTFEGPRFRSPTRHRRAAMNLSLAGKITNSCFFLTYQSAYFIQDNLQWREVYYQIESHF